MLYENPKNGSSRLSELYVETKLQFPGSTDIIIWHVITEDDIPVHTNTHLHTGTPMHTRFRQEEKEKKKVGKTDRVR